MSILKYCNSTTTFCTWYVLPCSISTTYQWNYQRIIILSTPLPTPTSSATTPKIAIAPTITELPPSAIFALTQRTPGKCFVGFWPKSHIDRTPVRNWGIMSNNLKGFPRNTVIVGEIEISMAIELYFEREIFC